MLRCGGFGYGVGLLYEGCWPLIVRPNLLAVVWVGLNYVESTAVWS